MKYNKLKAKLQEEVDEFLEDNNAEELADILEVIYAIYDLHKQQLSSYFSRSSM